MQHLELVLAYERSKTANGLNHPEGNQPYKL